MLPLALVDCISNPPRKVGIEALAKARLVLERQRKHRKEKRASEEAKALLRLVEGRSPALARLSKLLIHHKTSIDAEGERELGCELFPAQGNLDGALDASAASGRELEARSSGESSAKPRAENFFFFFFLSRFDQVAASRVDHLLPLFASLFNKKTHLRSSDGVAHGLHDVVGGRHCERERLVEETIH